MGSIDSARQGGDRAEPRPGLRPDVPALIRHLAIALIALGALGAACPAGATPAPRLRALLKSARLVVSGQVTGVMSYDDDRVAVVEFSAEQVLKGSLPSQPPVRIALVELHEGPTRPTLAMGAHGIAFLQPAARMSYLAKILPAGTYYELLADFGSFVSAASPAEAEQQTAVVARLVAAARGEGLDARAARQLTFDLLGSPSPLLVEDGAAGLTDLDSRRELSPEETATLRTALLRANLPDRVRLALIRAVAQGKIAQAVPTLQSITAPPTIAEAAWQALDQLGAPPSEKSLEARLADRDPSVRAAAVRELLRRDGAAAVSQVAPVAIQDPDPSVRTSAVEALGALGKPEALPPLERVFTDSSGELQQATARAILAVGGQPAIDTLGRLAFSGPILSQRYAVLVLMTIEDPDPHKDEVLKRIGATHPDEDIRDLVTNGLPYREN